MISSLQSPGYRLVLFGSLFQMAAMNMQMVTNPYLIFRLTESPALLGIMSLAGAVPSIVVALFGGAIADRIQKKSILVGCFIFMALIALGIALALDSGQLSKAHAGSWWILMVASVVQGIVMGLMMPSLMAIVPEVVTRKQLMNAVALNNLSMSGLSLVIPSVAGVMIDKIGFESIYYSMAGLYAVGTIFFFLLPRFQRVSSGGGQIVENITNGFKYIQQNPTILLILVFTLIVVVLAMPFQQFLPIYVDDILHVGATGLGLLMSLSGVGSLVASLALTALPSRKRGLLLVISGLITGAALSVFAFSSLWGLSLILMIFIGLASALRGTIGNTLLQSYTDAAYMGRVLSLTFIQFSIMSVFTFLVGILAEAVNIQWIIGVMAMVLFAVSLGVLVSNRRLRQLE
jgi:MFS family permease